MNLFIFIVLVLATRAVIDVWMAGSIFQSTRDRMAASLERRTPVTVRSDLLDDDIDITPTDGNIIDYVPTWFLHLLQCWFCMSYHVSIILVGVCWALSEWHHWVWMLPVWALAVTEASILLNQVLPEHWQYDRLATENENENLDPETTEDPRDGRVETTP